MHYMYSRMHYQANAKINTYAVIVYQFNNCNDKSEQFWYVYVNDSCRKYFVAILPTDLMFNLAAFRIIWATT